MKKNSVTQYAMGILPTEFECTNSTDRFGLLFFFFVTFIVKLFPTTLIDLDSGDLQVQRDIEYR